MNSVVTRCVIMCFATRRTVSRGTVITRLLSTLLIVTHMRNCVSIDLRFFVTRIASVATQLGFNNFIQPPSRCESALITRVVERHLCADYRRNLICSCTDTLDGEDYVLTNIFITLSVLPFSVGDGRNAEVNKGRRKINYKKRGR